MTAEPLPAWVVPPIEGYTAEDLDRIPDLPPHTELIDGNLVFVSPQKIFHFIVLNLLNRWLDDHVPSDLLVMREMTVTLGRRQRPEPDLAVVRKAAFIDMSQTNLQATDTVLVIEVVSPESEVRDRERKPLLYAEAGIGHFWLVENENGRPVVHVYELDSVTHSYVATGVHRDRLKVSVPFPIDIDLTEVESFGK
jgi:Uma2 family endonuclease